MKDRSHNNGSRSRSSLGKAFERLDDWLQLMLENAGTFDNTFSTSWLLASTAVPVDQPVTVVQLVKGGLGRIGVVVPSAVHVPRVIVATDGTGNGMENGVLNGVLNGELSGTRHGGTQQIAMGLEVAPGSDRPVASGRTNGLAPPAVRVLSVAQERPRARVGGPPDLVLVVLADEGVSRIARVPSPSEREAGAASPTGVSLQPHRYNVSWSPKRQLRPPRQMI